MVSPDASFEEQEQKEGQGSPGIRGRTLAPGARALDGNRNGDIHLSKRGNASIGTDASRLSCEKTELDGGEEKDKRGSVTSQDGRKQGVGDRAEDVGRRRGRSKSRRRRGTVDRIVSHSYSRMEPSFVSNMYGRPAAIEWI